MPDLDRFYREAADKAAILAVTPTSSETGIRSLLTQGGYSFPMMLDEGAVASAYKVRYVPSLFVIDAQGDLVDRVVGSTDFSKLSALVEDLSN
jgi:hypothetical protein